MSKIHYNKEYPSDIIPLMPQGTNSTMFTGCCGTTICDDQAGCPSCRRPVIGDEEKTAYERGRVRWNNATRFWKRK